MLNLELTTRQKVTIEIIKKLTDNNGYPPSNREITTELGLKSSSTTQAFLVALKEKLYYVKEGQVRALKVIKPAEEIAI